IPKRRAGIPDRDACLTLASLCVVRPVEDRCVIFPGEVPDPARRLALHICLQQPVHPIQDDRSPLEPHDMDGPGEIRLHRPAVLRLEPLRICTNLVGRYPERLPVHSPQRHIEEPGKIADRHALHWQIQRMQPRHVPEFRGDRCPDRSRHDRQESLPFGTKAWRSRGTLTVRWHPAPYPSVPVPSSCAASHVWVRTTRIAQSNPTMCIVAVSIASRNRAARRSASACGTPTIRASSSSRPSSTESRSHTSTSGRGIAPDARRSSMTIIHTCVLVIPHSRTVKT